MSFQLFNLRFLVTDNGQLFPDQVSHFCACACGLVLDDKKLPNLPQRKSERLGALYKRQTTDGNFRKFPVTGGCS